MTPLTDYLAAVAHKHLIYQQAIGHKIPDARIAFTFYPYSASILDPESNVSPERRQYYEQFWSRHEARPTQAPSAPSLSGKVRQ